LKDIEVAIKNPQPPAQNILDDVSSAYILAERIAPLLASSKRVAGNPRIIKRMLNTIRMRMSVAKRRSMPLDEALIAKLVLFERCAGDSATNELFRLISVAPDGKPPELLALEKTKGATPTEELPAAWLEESEFINEWATLEPALAAIDLRPAAYLAREILPVRVSMEGLSAEAASAVSSMLKIAQASSPTGIEVAKSIAADQREAAVRAIMNELAKVADWKGPPSGFYGAVIIADLSPEAGKVFSAFLKSHSGKPPAWMEMALKNKAWWKG
jgi:predicted KAP-like P-loop ATPase